MLSHNTRCTQIAAKCRVHCGCWVMRDRGQLLYTSTSTGFPGVASGSYLVRSRSTKCKGKFCISVAVMDGAVMTNFVLAMRNSGVVACSLHIYTV